jgi:UDP-3-O-[3-hydroxymyristoyl] glucosamine N-acyltransferase
VELTLKHIAKSIGGSVVGDDRISITGINSLLEAEKGEISFLVRPQLREQAKSTRASALIVKEEIGLYGGPQVIVSDPYLAYAKVATLFEPPIPRFPGISERAVIEEGTQFGDNVSIYPLAYVGRECVLGSKAIIFPGVYLGDRVTVGEETILYPNVTVLSDCMIGKHCIIHAGTVIGSDGFGFVKDGDTNVKIPQTGIVEIEDNVEIGANNTIDRAALGRTLIRQGVKTDNLVQIGHNVLVDENTVIVAQVGISGSTKIGKRVVIGGQVGLADHIEVGDRVMIGSKSGVAQSIPAGEVVSGIPTMPHRHWLRTTGHIKRLPEYVERIKELENKVRELEEQLKRE